MVFPKTVWLVIAAALLISSIGFKKYVWFISLGYGFSAYCCSRSTAVG